MDRFWAGFEKRAAGARGLFSKGGISGLTHTAPRIPGPISHVGKAAALPGQGAMIPGVRVPMKRAVQSRVG